jgi:outer membrane immunogenic protein
MTFKLIKAGVAALGVLSLAVAAQAADMPIKAPYLKAMPSTVVSYYNWTGFYAGFNAGYGFGTATMSGFPGASAKPKGFLAGGTLGYNWQSGAIVYGIEGDFDWSGVKGDVACDVLVTCHVANPWLMTFRGRVGYAFDRWLPYLTGGAAYGKVKVTDNPTGGVVTSASSNELGWVFGAGLEYAVMGSWTVKLEYLHVDLGSFNAGPAPLVNTVGFKENILRAGLNYKFSGPVFSRF